VSRGHWCGRSQRTPTSSSRAWGVHARHWEVVPTIAAADLWIADRNFCVRAFLCAIRERQGSFIIRQGGSFSTAPPTPMHLVGRSPSSAVYEQAVEIADEAGPLWRLRRISVKLTAPTRNGHTTLVVLTDLSAEVADAAAVVELYRTRWRIEIYQPCCLHIVARGGIHTCPVVRPCKPDAFDALVAPRRVVRTGTAAGDGPQKKTVLP
jgi:hypothetical protein